MEAPEQLYTIAEVRTLLGISKTSWYRGEHAPHRWFMGRYVFPTPGARRIKASDVALFQHLRTGVAA